MKSLGEFIALARAKPDTLNVAAAAGNSDLILSAFIKTQGLPVARVPYRDIQQAPNDLAEARIHLLMSSYATMRPLVQAGKLRVLAVTSRKRVEIAADIPTVAEAGYPYLGLDSLIGIYGPRGMSNALRESIAADVRAVVEADPTIASRLAATGQVIDIRGPAEFAAGIKEIRDQLASIAQTLGMKAATSNSGGSDMDERLTSSWPGRRSRPSTSCLRHSRKTWMPATSAGMTMERKIPGMRAARCATVGQTAWRPVARRIAEQK